MMAISNIHIENYHRYVCAYIPSPIVEAIYAFIAAILLRQQQSVHLKSKEMLMCIVALSVKTRGDCNTLSKILCIYLI